MNGVNTLDQMPIPAARRERLRSLGHDFIEARREGSYVFDEAGRRYLDAVSGAGTFNLGRRPPELAAELLSAARETDQGNFPMLSREKAALAQALAAFVSGSLECVIFSVMRGEAMECACKIARGFTKRRELLTVEGGWYGQTGFALTLSERADRECYGPLIPDVRTMPFDDLETAAKCLSSATAAVIVEPIQAENACRRATTDFLRGLESLCRKTGALLIVDETQTNFGRAGRRFMFEAAGLSPDMLIVGEALGGGLFPIAATLLTQRVNTFMNAHPMIHMSTFGGTDVGCRVAKKAVELYAREKPWENAAARGAQLLAGLRELAAAPNSPIKAVHGEGLLIALELADPERALAFCRDAARNGLLVLPGEVATHTVVLRPSLLLTAQEADELLQAAGRCV